METNKQRYSLCPARLFFLIAISFLFSIGIVVAMIYIGPAYSTRFTVGSICILAILLSSIIVLIHRIRHAQALLVITPEGIQVNFTGFGKLIHIPWEQVLYAKYYAFSIDQYALGITLRDSTVWSNSLSLPEKILAKIHSVTTKTTITIQQNMVREPLENAVCLMKNYINFDDELIFQFEHPQKPKRNSIA